VLSTKFKTYAVVGILSAVTLAFSLAAQRKQDDMGRAFEAAHRVAPEIIQTKGLLPAYDQRVVAHYRMFGHQNFPMTNVSDFWVHAETDDWILLNGPRGTSTCPDVLGAFGAINAPGQAMSLSEVRMLASGFKGGPIALNVFVPRFPTAPAGLNRCSGIAYDKQTGRLRVGGKFIAYLAPSQPQLAALPH
jgi:hypothetical protein